MIGWELSRIAASVNGRLLGEDAPVRGVSIDTRTLGPGALFVAIRGDRFDGHDFVEDALRAGGVAAMVESDTGAGARIVVDDTRAALAELGAAYRRTLATRIVGVTGSSGKTTTCRLIDHVLSSALRGRSSAKSYNNIIGVPLTLLSASEKDEHLVCEMGTSSRGEIARLATIVRPDIGVVTSIGRAHLEGLVDLDGVRREKCAVGGSLTLIPAGDDALLACFSAESNVERIAAERVEIDSGGTSFVFAGESYRVPLVGAHHASNAAIAVRVAHEMGLTPPAIRGALATFVPPTMRFETRAFGGVTIINDAYNANPESMTASLRAFAAAQRDASRRVVVLGDMLELGEHSAAAHREIAALAGELGFDEIIGVGVAMSAALGDDAWLTMDELDAERVASRFREGDAVLLKGSRGIGLERVQSAWRSRSAEGAGA